MTIITITVRVRENDFTEMHFQCVFLLVFFFFHVSFVQWRSFKQEDENIDQICELKLVVNDVESIFGIFQK